MELGTWAEWATAAAETAAVFVALFLPYVERKRSESKAAKNFKLSLYATAVRSLESRNMDALRSLTSVAALTDAGVRNKDDLDVAQQILDLYDNASLEDATKEKEIRKLTLQIKPTN